MNLKNPKKPYFLVCEHYGHKNIFEIQSAKFFKIPKVKFFLGFGQKKMSIYSFNFAFTEFQKTCILKSDFNL